MNATVIDTLKFADRLKDAGFEPPQAAGLARALGDELAERVVTKRDLDEAVQSLHGTIKAMDARFEAMDAKFEAKFEAVESRFDAIDARLESQHREFSGKFNILVGTMALGFTLVIALIGYSLFALRPAAPSAPSVRPTMAQALGAIPARPERALSPAPDMPAA